MSRALAHAARSLFSCHSAASACRQTAANSSSSSRGISHESSSSNSSLPLHLQDQLVLKGMVFFGFHGALPEENVLGQRFVVDATLWADLSAAKQSDNLQDTIDYTKAYSAIKHVVEGPAKQLQEAVVDEVCQRLLGLDTRVTAVQVYLCKPHVALPGVLESIGVRAFRARQQ